MTSKQFRNAILTFPLALAIWSPALAEEARKAYAIGMLTLKNKEWVKEYGPKTAEIIKRHGGRYLISGSPSEALEGAEYPAVKLNRFAFYGCRRWTANTMGP